MRSASTRPRPPATGNPAHLRPCRLTAPRCYISPDEHSTLGNSRVAKNCRWRRSGSGADTDPRCGASCLLQYG